MNIELEVIDNVIQPKYVELKDGKYIANIKLPKLPDSAKISELSFKVDIKLE